MMERRSSSSTSSRQNSSTSRQGTSSNRKTFTRKRYCFFCREERTLGSTFSPDYKNVTLLRKFTTERGKIIPKNRSGLCAQHQRALGLAVKRARQLSLIQYSSHL